MHAGVFGCNHSHTQWLLSSGESALYPKQDKAIAAMQGKRERARKAGQGGEIHFNIIHI